MTLKQFFQLGIGIGVAVIIYRLPLPGIITVPLAIVAILIGVALAFVPINGRPFSQWILAFIRAVYSPTEFYWNVTGAIDNGQLKINNVKKIESSVQKVVVPTETVKVKLPEIDYKLAAKVSATTPDTENRAPSTQESMTDKVVLIKQKPKEEIKEEEIVEINWPPRNAGNHQSSIINDQKKPIPLDIKHYALNIDSNIPLDTENSTPLPPAPVGQMVAEVPKQVVYVSQPKQTIPVERKATDGKVIAAPTTKKIISPTNPNILAGLIVDGHDQVVEGAILEVVDSSGIPVRALRSNKLGQFQTGSPLSNGKYIIAVEKESLLFDSVSVEAKGGIIEPIVIKAKF